MNQKEQMSLNKLVTIFGTEIPFVRLVSILSLLGVGLFFVGWVYRWAYFAFFNLEINTINLSLQSFFFSPIQVFFGDIPRTFITIFSLILTAIGVYLLVWLYNLFTTLITKIAKFLYRKLNPNQPNAPPQTQNIINQPAAPPQKQKKVLKFLINVLKFLKSLAKKILRSLLSFGKTRHESLQILQGLLEEIISLSLVILVFYWLARTQGINDARRDASTASTLPAISFITKETQLPLGGKLDDDLAVAPVKGFIIIGDRGMFQSIQSNDRTDNNDPENPRIWRLLLKQDGWLYLFYNLPPNAPLDQRPLVLALKENQILILSPEPTQP